MAFYDYPTVAQMIANSSVDSHNNGDCILVAGYHAPGDGGGGTFYCRQGTIEGYSSNVWHDDGGLAIFNNIPARARWYQRLFGTPYVTAKWFGAHGDGVNDDTLAVNNSISCNGTVLWIPHLFNGFVRVIGDFDSVNHTFDYRARPCQTRVYFPAGVYIMTNNLTKPIGSGAAQGMQLKGEYAIFKPGVGYPTSWSIGNDMPAMLYLPDIIDVKFSGLTFKGFPFGVSINSSNLDSADFLAENCNFSDINWPENPAYNNIVSAIRLEGGSSYLELRNCYWRDCRHAINQHEGQTYTKGGYIKAAEWLEDHDWQILLRGTEWLSFEDTVCKVSEVASSSLAATCSWVWAYGNFRAVNMKFLPALPGKVNMGSIIYSVGTTLTWLNTGGHLSFASFLKLTDCHCSCSGSVVKMFRIHNSIVMENNYGFINDTPLVRYTNLVPIQNSLNYMGAMLSFKFDNIPNLPFKQGNRIYSPGDSKDQLKLLPFVRVNSGLTSYGYLEDVGAAPRPQELKFYLGRKSYKYFDTSLNFGIPGWEVSALAGGYSYRIRLYNLIENGSPSDMGKIFEYSEYRLETRVEYSPSDSGYQRSRIKNLLLISGAANADSPVLIWETLPFNDTDRIYLEAKDRGIYGIFYEITCLLPPVTRL